MATASDEQMKRLCELMIANYATISGQNKVGNKVKKGLWATFEKELNGINGATKDIHQWKSVID